MATLVGHKLQVWFDWLNEAGAHGRDQSACRTVYLQDVLLDLLYQSDFSSQLFCLHKQSNIKNCSGLPYLNVIYVFVSVLWIGIGFDVPELQGWVLFWFMCVCKVRKDYLCPYDFLCLCAVLTVVLDSITIIFILRLFILNK